jgi:hypothetical protein
VFLAAGTGPFAAHARAQEVEFVTRPRGEAELRLDALLRDGEYELWVRDTVLSPGEVVEGKVLVLQATVRTAAEIRGDVFVVDGDLFLRPGANISGDVLVLGGGYYGSSLAVVAGSVKYLPNDLYAVAPRAGGWTISPVRRVPRAIQLHGLHGFKAPTYERVDELTLAWGVTGRAVNWAGSPSLELVARFKTEQNSFEGTARHYWHPAAEFELGVEAERATRSNEDWARGAVSNSFAYLFTGDDFRDYYRSDRAAFVVRRAVPDGWSPRLVMQWEKARSIQAREQFALFGSDEDVRQNPPIDEGDTWSAILGVTYRQRTATGRIVVQAVLEAADSTVAGDFSFLLGDVRVRWRGQVVSGHQLDLFGVARGDLAGSVPGQRWSAFGGRVTLPTLPILSRRGPRLVYGQATYAVPVAALALGLLGTPELFFRVAMGAAWAEREAARFDANLMLGGRMSVFEAGVAVDPSGNDTDPAIYAMLSFPGDL